MKPVKSVHVEVPAISGVPFYPMQFRTGLVGHPFIVGTLLFLLPVLPVLPDGQSLAEMTTRIMEQQSVNTPGDVDPDLLSPSDLEELGFHVMGVIVDDDRWHDWMNEMLGGRGSPRVTAVHTRFARRFLEMDGSIPEWNNTIMAPGMTSGTWSPWFSPGRHILHRPIHLRIYHLLLIVAVSVIAVIGVSRRKK